MPVFVYKLKKNKTSHHTFLDSTTKFHEIASFPSKFSIFMSRPNGFRNTITKTKHTHQTNMDISVEKSYLIYANTYFSWTAELFLTKNDENKKKNKFFYVCFSLCALFIRNAEVRRDTFKISHHFTILQFFLVFGKRQFDINSFCICKKAQNVKKSEYFRNFFRCQAGWQIKYCINHSCPVARIYRISRQNLSTSQFILSNPSLLNPDAIWNCKRSTFQQRSNIWMEIVRLICWFVDVHMENYRMSCKWNARKRLSIDDKRHRRTAKETNFEFTVGKLNYGFKLMHKIGLFTNVNNKRYEVIIFCIMW